MNLQIKTLDTEVICIKMNSDVVVELLTLLRQARSMRDAVNGGGL